MTFKNADIYGLIVLGLLINVITLNNGHQWGGDFAQYIIQARNIVEHKPFDQGVMLENMLSYPPGFSFLLAPLFYVFGLNFLALKAFNILGYFAGLIVFHKIIAKSVDRSWQRWLIALLALNGFYFIFKQNVLADIPFFFFVMLTVLAWQERREWLMYVALAMCLAIKSTGMALWLAIAIQALLQKNVRRLIVLGIIVAGTQWLAVLCNGVKPGMFAHIGHDPLAFFKSMFVNGALMVQSASWVIFPTYHAITFWPSFVFQSLLTIVAPVLYGLGLWHLVKKGRDADGITLFIGVYMAMLFFWSGFNDSPQNFARYTLPILPLVLAKVLPLFKTAIVRFTVAAVLAFNILNIVLVFHYNDDDLVAMTPNQEIFEWVKSHTQEGHYMIWEPRPMALMTKVPGATLGILANSEPRFWPSILAQKGIAYVILSMPFDQGFYTTLQEQGMRPVYHNSMYVVLQ